MFEKNYELESEFNLFSEYNRLSILLTHAMDLAHENNKFNPLIIREYYSILKEIWRYLRPISEDKAEKSLLIQKKINELNENTLRAFYRLQREKNFKIPSSIFLELDSLHDLLFDLKQEKSLGLITKKKGKPLEKLRMALELNEEQSVLGEDDED